MTLKLGIVAGEPSGDRLGGDLLKALRSKCEVASFGIGGPEIAAQGVQSLVALDQLSMHGFAEPLKRLPFLWQTLKRVEEQMLDERVDVFVGVDFNVFNLLLEGRLKRRAVPVVHYVSPSVYAWRAGRTRRVARSADVLLTLFPFEPPLYDGQAVRAVFVGHPLADQIGPRDVQTETAVKARAETRNRLGLADGDVVVTLMPGSRMSEIGAMLPAFLQTARLVQKQRPEVRFFLPCATQAIEAVIRAQLQQPEYAGLAISLVTAGAREILAVTDAALIKSGTSTLEAMLLGVPMVVAYRLPRLTYEIVRRMLRTEFVALPNILAGQALVPELLQNDMQPLALSAALMRQLDADNQLLVKRRFAQIHARLRCGASANAAREVLQLARDRGFRDS